MLVPAITSDNIKKWCKFISFHGHLCKWRTGRSMGELYKKKGSRGNRLTCSLRVQGLDHCCQQPCSTAKPFGQRHILQELSLLPDETNCTIISPLSYFCYPLFKQADFVLGHCYSAMCETWGFAKDSSSGSHTIADSWEKCSMHILFPT